MTASRSPSRAESTTPPRVVLDAGWLGDDARVLSNPISVLTERDGIFFDTVRGTVDPVAWLEEASQQHLLAGFLSFEFAWNLDDVRAARRTHPFMPLLWVGRFSDDSHQPYTPVLVPESAVLGPVSLSVTPDAYLAAAGRCIEDIEDGELFEVNYTERVRADWNGTAAQLFEAMRRRAEGEYFSLFQIDAERAVVSVSPEMFLQVHERDIVTRPIKGTIARGDDPDSDREARATLLASEKDRAENVMIVDLMRNDLSGICEPGSVHVPALCEVESFASLHHLVSTVRGTLHRDVTAIEALLHCFPAGSISGAPKLRAIERIAKHEATPRGPYTGAGFVCRPNGWLRSSVLIRTAAVFEHAGGPSSVEYGVGGAVVADSSPQAELDEAWLKARPLTGLQGRGDA